MKVSLVPTELIDGLRGWFHPKDRSVVLASSCFIEGQEIVTPGTPVVGRRRLYAKNGCWYDLGSNGTETGLCVSGVDPAGHTHSKIVASDGAPDPALSADASGYLAAAVQPLFSAYNSSTDANCTGDGTAYTVICDTEIADRNSNYNNGTGVFTAPVTGNVHLLFLVRLSGAGAAHTYAFITVITSNRTYYFNECNLYNITDNAGNASLLASVVADMDAGDTVYCQVTVSNGTKTISVGGNTPNPVTLFQGYLLP